jgi:putative MATE family efflux protein
MKLENDLGNDPILRLVFRIAIPSMLGQFVSVLYSIVDRMYIGNIPEIGDLALAGVGVCGPILTMIGSVAFWVGVGGAPLMSMRMGEQNNEAAKKILSNCFLLLGVFAVLLMLLVYPFHEPMLRLFGASDTTFPYAKAYFITYLTGTVFALFSTGMNQFIICQGFAKTGMLSVLLGAVLNILLDPLFIFVFDLGVVGAAIATVLSQAASCTFVLCFLFGKRVPIRISFGGYSLSTIWRILCIGFTPFIIIAIDNVMIIVMNAVLQHFGGETSGDLLVTCATIAQSFMLVVTMPLGGISGGTQTILGYNYGARKVDRVQKAQIYIFMLCAAYTAIMFLFARLAGPLFVSLFTQDAALTEQALWAIRICTLMIIPLGIQYEIVDGFTAIGQVQLSLPLSFFRKLIYFVAIFILPFLGEAKLAFYAEPISDLIAPIVSIVIYLIFMKKVLRKRTEHPDALDDTLASGKAIPVSKEDSEE